MEGLEGYGSSFDHLPERRMVAEKHLGDHFLPMQAAARSETQGNVNWLPGHEAYVRNGSSFVVGERRGPFSGNSSPPWGSYEQ